jgi:hypothetical protein
MDQGIHEVRLLIIACTPADVRLKVAPLADWLSGPPAAYAHLPIGVPNPTKNQALAAILASLPSNVVLLACKRSWDGQSLILRVQATSGSPSHFVAPGNPQNPIAFGAFEIKTLRMERDGPVHEVNLISEK